MPLTARTKLSFVWKCTVRFSTSSNDAIPLTLDILTHTQRLAQPVQSAMESQPR
jgi:hypothetical protein